MNKLLMQCWKPIYRALLIFLLGTQLFACSVFSGSVPLPVTEDDKELVLESESKIKSNIPLITSSNPNQSLKVYVVAFDGTMNDKERVTVGERASVVAHLSALIKETTVVKTKYYAGAGMKNPSSIDFVDALLGFSCVKTAELAAHDFYEQAKLWLAEDPHTEIRIFVMGFSRGAATARHFMNNLDQGWENQAIKFHSLGLILKQPHFYSLLYDTVSTGQTDTLNLQLPPSLDYLIHFIAKDEPRSLFEPIIDTTEIENNRQPIWGFSDPFQPDRINLLVLPGAHSDIGATYAEGIGNEYIRFSEVILSKMGLISTNCWESEYDSYQYGKHDSRGVLDVITGQSTANIERHALRLYHGVTPAFISYESKEQLKKKLGELAMASTGGITHFFKRTEGLKLKVQLADNQLNVIEFNQRWIDPMSFIFTENNGIRKLQYRMLPPFENRNSTLILFDEIWDKLDKQNTNTISLNTLQYKGKFFLGYYVNDARVKMEQVHYENGASEGSVNSKINCVRDDDGSMTSRIKAFVIDKHRRIYDPRS